MQWLGQIDASKFLLFTLVLTRVSGLTISAPIYGTSEIPPRVRILLAFTLALLITPTQWHVPIEHPGTTVNYLVFVGSELMVGMCLGLGITIMFSGIQLAGQLIGRTGGLMMAETVDPTQGTNVPLFSRLLFLVAMAVFVCIGGHRMVMAGLLDTFATIPPGSGIVSNTIGETFVTLVAQSFSLGFRTAMPAVTALLLSTLVLGLIGRTMPQLNILMVGFGMNSMLSFAVFSLSLGAAVWAFQDQIEPAMEMLLDALHTPLRLDSMS